MNIDIFVANIQIFCPFLSPQAFPGFTQQIDKLVFVRKAAHPLPPLQAREARGVRNSPSNTNFPFHHPSFLWMPKHPARSCRVFVTV